jgi:hypothetical protein
MGVSTGEFNFCGPQLPRSLHKIERRSESAEKTPVNTSVNS